LGLAVCHTIVERLGGGIEAANREQGGAVFEVRLPAA
ncbi:MAG: ATP-binding protein, partial [Polyangiales bacterium]